MIYLLSGRSATPAASPASSETSNEEEEQDDDEDEMRISWRPDDVDRDDRV